MNSITSIGLTALLILAGQFVRAEGEPVKVGGSFTKIYIPAGFDSNDHVQVVGEGSSKNSCYRPAETKIKIDGATKTITLEPTFYEYQGVCLQVITPNQRVVELGVLAPGKWQILQASSVTPLTLMSELNIRPATSVGADDYLYAPIYQAYFYQKNGVNKIVMTGEFTNSCMTIQEVKVTVEPEVLVIQPIARMESNGNCLIGSYPFTKTIVVEGMKTQSYLLHIRSLNGNAVNSLIKVK